ncbi:MAG: hypothetical protein WC670_04615 [Pseudolabrys sp.]
MGSKMAKIAQKKKITEHASGQPRRQQEALMDSRFEQQEKVLVSAYVQVLRDTDESDAKAWAYIVTKAVDGGLSKEILCQELSYDWSTMTRWMAGRSAPPPFTRRALKQEFIRLLQTRPFVFAAE